VGHQELRDRKVRETSWLDDRGKGRSEDTGFDEWDEKREHDVELGTVTSGLREIQNTAQVRVL